MSPGKFYLAPGESCRFPATPRRQLRACCLSSTPREQLSQGAAWLPPPPRSDSSHGCLNPMGARRQPHHHHTHTQATPLGMDAPVRPDLPPRGCTQLWGCVSQRIPRSEADNRLIPASQPNCWEQGPASFQCPRAERGCAISSVLCQLEQGPRLSTAQYSPMAGGGWAISDLPRPPSLLQP